MVINFTSQPTWIALIFEYYLEDSVFADQFSSHRPNRAFYSCQEPLESYFDGHPSCSYLFFSFSVDSGQANLRMQPTACVVALCSRNYRRTLQMPRRNPPSQQQPSWLSLLQKLWYVQNSEVGVARTVCGRNASYDVLTLCVLVNSWIFLLLQVRMSLTFILPSILFAGPVNDSCARYRVVGYALLPFEEVSCT